MLDKPEQGFDDWRKKIKEEWGETVAGTVAQADFYAFAKRIHENQPGLSHIFEARIF